MPKKSEDSLRRTVGQRVLQLREERGWRQVDLERETGVAQPTLSQIQSGKRFPSAKTLVSLANAFGVHPAALLLDPDNQKQLAALEALLRE